MQEKEDLEQNLNYSVKTTYNSQVLDVSGSLTYKLSLNFFQV